MEEDKVLAGLESCIEQNNEFSYRYAECEMHLNLQSQADTRICV